MERINPKYFLVLISLIFLFACKEDESSSLSIAMPPPSEVVATIESSNKINIAWKDNSTDEVGFIVQRIEGIYYATYKNIARLEQNTTTYSDTTVSPNGIYNYKIIAINGKGETTESQETTNFSPTPMAQPKLEVTQFKEKFYAKIDSISIEKTFTVQCTNLSNDIVITSPSNFLISFGGNKGYSSILTIPLTYNSGISQRINVKYYPHSSGEKVDSITVVSGDLVRKVGVMGSTNF